MQFDNRKARRVRWSRAGLNALRADDVAAAQLLSVESQMKERIAGRTSIRLAADRKANTKDCAVEVTRPVGCENLDLGHRIVAGSPSSHVAGTPRMTGALTHWPR